MQFMLLHYCNNYNNRPETKYCFDQATVSSTLPSSTIVPTKATMARLTYCVMARFRLLAQFRVSTSWLSPISTSTLYFARSSPMTLSRCQKQLRNYARRNAHACTLRGLERYRCRSLQLTQYSQALRQRNWFCADATGAHTCVYRRWTCTVVLPPIECVWCA